MNYKTVNNCLQAFKFLGQSIPERLLNRKYNKNSIENCVTTRIEHLRKQNQYTKATLARYLNIYPQRLNSLYIGESSWRVEYLIKLAFLFDVDLNWLITGGVDLMEHKNKIKSSFNSIIKKHDPHISMIKNYDILNKINLQ